MTSNQHRIQISVVADQQQLFTLKVPNTETRAAMTEADTIANSHHARFASAAELFGPVGAKLRFHDI